MKKISVIPYWIGHKKGNLPFASRFDFVSSIDNNIKLNAFLFLDHSIGFFENRKIIENLKKKFVSQDEWCDYLVNILREKTKKNKGALLLIKNDSELLVCRYLNQVLVHHQSGLKNEVFTLYELINIKEKCDFKPLIFSNETYDIPIEKESNGTVLIIPIDHNSSEHLKYFFLTLPYFPKQDQALILKTILMPNNLERRVIELENFLESKTDFKRLRHEKDIKKNLLKYIYWSIVVVAIGSTGYLAYETFVNHTVQPPAPAKNITPHKPEAQKTKKITPHKNITNQSEIKKQPKDENSNSIAGSDIIGAVINYIRNKLEKISTDADLKNKKETE